MARYDVVFRKTGPTIEYHFCREWDGDVGCYGTNETHGMDLKDAAIAMAEWHEREAASYRDGTNHELVEFKNEGLTKEANGD